MSCWVICFFSSRRRHTRCGRDWSSDVCSSDLATDTEVTVEEMLICCKAVRRGAKRALVSCDIPNGPTQKGADAAVSAAIRFSKEGGADMVKVLGDPGMVKAVVRAGVPVFAEFHGENLAVDKLVEKAKRLQDAGASILDFRHSGPVADPAVARA